MSEKLLDVKNLHTSFFTHLGEVQAIRDVSFGLDKGEIIGIVGESGSGCYVTFYYGTACISGKSKRRGDSL